jgi:hypothetical protein
LPTTTGKIILRSGDYRAYAEVTGYGTPLTEKNLSSSPVYNEGGIAKNFRVGDGFTAESGNYTVEFRAKIDEGSSQSVDAFAVTPGGASFKAYVEPKAIGIYNGENKVSLYNLQTTTTGGNSTFYNNDGKYHTYRFAVTSDKRIFAYRDGIQIATLRSQDYGNQASWGTENGDLSENLLKNPGFEGEVGYRATDSLFNQVEGWIVDPIDQYNCTYSCPTYEIDNTLDFNNHVMKLQRYNWNDGWGAGTVSQIVDVAPNTTYSLSFLAAGGMNTNSKGACNAYVKMQETQNTTLGESVEITNQSGLQSYGMSYTTSADCKQLTITLYQERFLDGNGWGSSPAPFYVDEMVLTGTSRQLDQKTGFTCNNKATMEYFTFDCSGAYAPALAEITPAESEVTIEGTGNSKAIDVKIANLVSTDPISVTATSGFEVFPEVLSPSADGKIYVTLTSTLPETTGKVILRSGDIRSYIDLTGIGTELPEKSLSESPVYSDGNDSSMAYRLGDGFTATEGGYTVEFRVKLSRDISSFAGYAVTPAGAGFKAYVEPESMGFYNGTSQVSFSNPATSAGNGTFYNHDGNYHTYRYAVASDGRVFAYRDGLLVSTQRTHDYGNQADWATENGDISENLLKNPGFEGEVGYRSDKLLNQVEGWIVDPIDQYNCNYYVPNYEIDNTLDYNNHVMKLQRYNWNDGWGAGTVSQIVDVAPNSTYSLSFLACGGMNTNSKGACYAYVKMQEAQNTDLGESVQITNQSGLEPYGMSYTTSAECKQLKITLYQERFLDGNGWGSSPAAFLVDEMELAGVSRALDQKAGFENNACKIEYFTFDCTGAYAPLTPTFGSDFEDSLDSVEAINNMTTSTDGNDLYIFNVADGASVDVYNAAGMHVATINNYHAGSAITLPGLGFYICTVKDAKGTKSVKVLL